MKKIRLNDDIKEYFNVIDQDENGYYVFGSIVSELIDEVIINTPDYGRVLFPKNIIIKGD